MQVIHCALMLFLVVQGFQTDLHGQKLAMHVHKRCSPLLAAKCLKRIWNMFFAVFTVGLMACYITDLIAIPEAEFDVGRRQGKVCHAACYGG